MIKLLKFTPPSHYDLWPQGTLWQDGDELYIQVTNNPESAKWITIGKFLQGALDHLINDDKFIHDCLKLYNHVSDRPEIRVLEPITEE